MAISKSQTQVEWSSSASSTITSGNNDTSDVVAISDDAVHGSVQIKADNQGTPTSGDEVEIRILYTLGDPDADPDSADEYDTVEHALPILLDTNSEDPAIKTVAIDVAAKSFKVYADNQAASSVIVSAQYSEQTNS